MKAATTVATVTTEATATSIERRHSDAGRLDREAARARAGKLFGEHGTLIERICRHLLRDEFEAEDAAQQTFLSAYRALLGGAEPRDGEAWLATIARRECLERIRARVGRPLSVHEVELEDHTSNVHERVLGRAAAARLWREIGRLPQQQRDAVLLREIAGLSYEELGVMLGVTQPAVESLLFRARSNLRDRLRAALASLNIAGVVSEAVAAVARLAGSGAAPVAVKAAAVGVGVAVAGGGGIAAERRLELPAAEAQSSRAVAHPAPRRAPAPDPVRVRRHVSHAAPVRVERQAAPVVHAAPAPVQVELEHHEIEHRRQGRADETPVHRDDHGRERGEDTTTQTPPTPPVPAAPSPVEHHDEGSDGPPPVTAVTTTVAHDTGTSGDGGGHEGPGPGTTTTTVAVPSSSGEGSSSDHHDETEGGAPAVVETDGGGGGDDAETSTTTSTTAPPTTAATTTTTTTTTTGADEVAESGSGDGGGHPGRH